jgi:peptide subunit release factor 1 (eRF1)
MIDSDGVTRLMAIRAPDHGIVSVYLTVPQEPAGLRALPAHLDEVLAQCDRPGDGEVAARARRSEVAAIRRELGTHAHNWLGRSIAFFACDRLGLLETVPLRGTVRDRAMIGSRPYVRPLLAELRRCPSYSVAVVNRRHAWLFLVSGEGTEEVGHLQSETVASRRFGGWHGFQASRNEQRARVLAKQHYAAAAAGLASAVERGGCGAVVVGGHEPETGEFISALPPSLRARVAGKFVIDPRKVTAARVRQLADEVVAKWEESRERELAATLAEHAPASMTAIGLDACLAAANQRAIQLLMVPDDEVRPGFTCDRCGTLAVAEGSCPACGQPTRAVGDVIEELAVKVTEDGGSVQPVRGAGVLVDVAARRRFPGPG